MPQSQNIVPTAWQMAVCDTIFLLRKIYIQRLRCCHAKSSIYVEKGGVIKWKFYIFYISKYISYFTRRGCKVSQSVLLATTAKERVFDACKLHLLLFGGGHPEATNSPRTRGKHVTGALYCTQQSHSSFHPTYTHWM